MMKTINGVKNVAFFKKQFASPFFLSLGDRDSFIIVMCGLKPFSPTRLTSFSLNVLVTISENHVFSHSGQKNIKNTNILSTEYALTAFASKLPILLQNCYFKICPCLAKGFFVELTSNTV